MWTPNISPILWCSILQPKRVVIRIFDHKILGVRLFVCRVLEYKYYDKLFMLQSHITLSIKGYKMINYVSILRPILYLKDYNISMLYLVYWPILLYCCTVSSSINYRKLCFHIFSHISSAEKLVPISYCFVQLHFH